MTMQLLKQIRLRNWKSIADETVELKPLNVIIGANGSGKSNLISVFKMMNAMFAHEPGFRNYIGQSGGADSILHFGKRKSPTAEMEVTFDTDTGETKYVANWAAAAQDTLIFTDERAESRRSGTTERGVSHIGAGHTESRLEDYARDRNDDRARVTLGLVRRCRLFHFHDTSANAAVRDASYIEANRFLYPDAGNLASMLYLFEQQHPTAFRRISGAAKQMIPAFHSFLLEPSRLNDKQILLKWFQSGSDYEFGPHQLSDGSIRFLALATLFSQPPELMPLLIAIDEPELGLHPSALEVLAGMVKSASQHCQVILATQSSTLLDHFDAGDVIVANSQNGASVFNRLSEADLDSWLKDYSLGEIWEKNVVGGGPYG
jgi:predicted ATPase